MTPPTDNRILWVRSLNLAYLRIHKNACSALTRALEHEASVEGEHTPPRAVRPEWYRKDAWLNQHREGGPNVVAMLRDPWQRQESMYRFFVDQGNLPRPHSQEGFERWLLQLNKEQLMAEPHFAPQYWHCCEGGKFIPTILLRWEFPAFEKLFGVTVHKHHDSTPYPLEWTPVMQAHFTGLYHEDIKLWWELPE